MPAKAGPQRLLKVATGTNTIEQDKLDEKFIQDHGDFFGELTPELAAVLVRAAKKGAPDRYTALSCCVLPEDLQVWLVKGCSPGATGLEREFAAAYLKQVGDLAKRASSELLRAGKDWQAPNRFLETRFPVEYGRAPKPAPDPIAGGAARVSKRDQFRAALKKRDPELVEMLAAEGWGPRGPSDGDKP